MATEERKEGDLFIKDKSQRRTKNFFVTSSAKMDDKDGVNATTISSSVFQQISKSFAEGTHLLNTATLSEQGPILYMLQEMQADIDDVYNEVSASAFQASYFPFATIDSGSIGVFSSSLIPDKDDSHNLGSSTHEWKNLYVDGTANIDKLAVDAIATDLLPVTPAGKGQGQNIGSTKLRWSRIFLASHIDVSGSNLIISSPSASAVGDPFDVVVSGSMTLSGSIAAADLESGSIGTIEAPFKDLYVQSSSIYLADMSNHNGKSWKQMSKSEKLQRATVFRKDDVDKLKRGESLNDSGHISASGDFHVVGRSHLKGITLIEGNTTIDGETDIKGGFKVNGQEITDNELRALRGFSHGDGDIQSQLNSKEPTIGSSNRVDASHIGTGVVSNTEFNYVNGVTSAIQTQINTKALKTEISGSFTSLSASIATDIGNAGGTDLTRVDSHIVPDGDNTRDLGTSAKEFRNLYVDGTAYLDSIAGGSITGNMVFKNSLIFPSVTQLTSISNGLLDMRLASVAQIKQKSGTWSITSARAADVFQEITIIGLTAGVIRHSAKGAAFGFMFANGSNLAVSAGQAYKFIADGNLIWRQIH